MENVKKRICLAFFFVLCVFSVDFAAELHGEYEEDYEELPYVKQLDQAYYDVESGKSISGCFNPSKGSAFDVEKYCLENDRFVNVEYRITVNENFEKKKRKEPAKKASTARSSNDSHLNINWAYFGTGLITMALGGAAYFYFDGEVRKLKDMPIEQRDENYDQKLSDQEKFKKIGIGFFIGGGCAFIVSFIF